MFEDMNMPKPKIQSLEVRMRQDVREIEFQQIITVFDVLDAARVPEDVG